MVARTWFLVVGAGVVIVAALAMIGAIQTQAIAGETERVSVTSAGEEANGSSDYASLSDDGRFVAFQSTAADLVEDDGNGETDVFLHDRQSGATTRVSVTSEGDEALLGQSTTPDVSANGRYIAFYSIAENLVEDDDADFADIFVHDMQTGETARVSVSTDGVEGDDDAEEDPSISGDGRYVAFESRAENLVADDDNDRDDIFVHDRQTGETTRVSESSAGAQADGSSSHPSISDDGRFVAFSSQAENLILNDGNGAADIFVHDRQTGQTTRVSVDSSGNEADEGSYRPVISGDGRYVAFESMSPDFVDDDTNGILDIFVHDRQTGETTRVNVDSDGTEALTGVSSEAGISDDGRFVSFQSSAANLVPNDGNGANDAFVHDQQTGETTRVSVDSSGNEASGFRPDISGNGQFVAFGSVSADLVSGDNNGQGDVFVHDRGTETTPTATPSATPSPTATATPSPTPSSTPEATPTPSPTGEPGPELVQGDADCDGDADAVDALKTLQEIAALPYGQEPDCPEIGGALPAAPASEPPEVFGDVDCDGDVDAVDALKILQFVAAIPFAQTEPCTDIGGGL